MEARMDAMDKDLDARIDARGKALEPLAEGNKTMRCSTASGAGDHARVAAMAIENRVIHSMKHWAQLACQSILWNFNYLLIFIVIWCFIYPK